MTLPSRQEQIVQSHAALILSVVQAIQNPQLMPQLEEALRVSEQNGWSDLVRALRRVIDGARDTGVLVGLDAEDRTIVEAVLAGLQNPASLPNPDQRADATLAAPGLAAMIHAARKGDVNALQLLANMAEQMTAIGGDMGKLGGLMKRLVDGERDPDSLAEGMTPTGESLVNSLLEELGKLETH